MLSKIAVYDSSASNYFSVNNLLGLYRSFNVDRLIFKKLSPNDNSKNQPYMGGHLTDLGFLPTSEIVASDSKSNKSNNPKRQIKYTTELNYSWLSPEGKLYKAPNAKLIYYPQYPEVRLSGFLAKCEFDMGGWMDPTKKGRSEGRVLFFGIKNSGEILAYLATPDSRIAKEIDDYNPTELSGIFRELIISRNNQFSQTDLFTGIDEEVIAKKVADEAGVYATELDLKSNVLSPKETLIRELRRIHLKYWIQSKRLNTNGVAIPYSAMNGGGYTMEAELGIIPNGIAEPDFMGWEVKQFGVKKIHLINSKPLTLMTPEPDGGHYVDRGVEMFVRKYGKPNTKGILNRYDFTGKHVANVPCTSTNLTLVSEGFDLDSNAMTNAAGSIALLDTKGNIASSWSFTKLMKIWMRKHAKAVYIPSISQKEPGTIKEYYYGKNVRLFEGTSIIRLLKAIEEGHVYYDPGIKLENADTNPKTKRRSQFRIKSASLDKLYDKQKVVDVLEN